MTVDASQQPSATGADQTNATPPPPSSTTANTATAFTALSCTESTLLRSAGSFGHTTAVGLQTVVTFGPAAREAALSGPSEFPLDPRVTADPRVASGHDRVVVTSYAPDVAEQTDPEGNERLTSIDGVLLILLLAAEGVTILSVRQLITPHIVIGLVLIGPVVLKCVSTIYRFVRYYTGTPEYVRKGAPPLLLRVIGPLVVLSSLAVLGTGVGLLAVKPGDGTVLTLHKASFIIWIVLMTVHVLGHVIQAGRSTVAEYRRMPDPAQRKRRALRSAAIVVSLVAGVGLAAGLLPTASPWINRHDHGFHRVDH